MRHVDIAVLAAAFEAARGPGVDPAGLPLSRHLRRHLLTCCRSALAGLGAFHPGAHCPKDTDLLDVASRLLVGRPVRGHAARCPWCLASVLDFAADLRSGTTPRVAPPPGLVERCVRRVFRVDRLRRGTTADWILSELPVRDVIDWVAQQARMPSARYGLAVWREGWVELEDTLTLASQGVARADRLGLYVRLA